MAVRREDEGSLDDIELLNIHKYPESVPASVAAHVRNSKVYQKRLEELQKSLPAGKRRVQFVPPEGQTAESSVDQPSVLAPLVEWIRKILK